MNCLGTKVILLVSKQLRSLNEGGSPFAILSAPFTTE